MFLLVQEPIDVMSVLQAVEEPSCGAVNLFLGTVRDHSKGKTVLKLHYEAYAPMALQQMEAIGELAQRKFGVTSVAVVHRLGTLMVGDVSVAVAVASPHRGEAFRACRFVINRIKQDVPIWKKEFTEKRAAWV